MLQKDLLLPWRSILDNIILGMEVRGVPRTQAVAKAMPLIEKYGLKGFDGHHPSELSGGMRQRAALLRALALPEHLSTAALLDVLGTLTTREELVEECNKIVANRE